MGLGMSEIMVILVIALIIFGPRKLPELGKSIGQAMGQFRKASDEFKRTWEQEVELEKVRKGDSSSSHSSNYDSNYQSESGYSADSDFNYDYGSSNTDSLSASETAAANGAETTPAALPEPATTQAATAEKKAEAHWI
jgi:TatA/E family protein of Tat protein translocase